MRVLVILGHPTPGSFNHAIAQTTVKTLKECAHEVVFHDLCAEGFEGALPTREIPDDGKVDAAVREHCRELAAADGVIVVHPNWWGMPPAVLKGWVDRVFRPGVAYRFREGDSGEGVPEGLLKARCALVFTTSNTEPKRERTVFGDPLERIWKDCIFGLCGVKDFYRRNFEIIVTSTLDQRREWLAEVRRTVSKHFPPA